MCSTTSSSVTPPSSRPSVKANPALVRGERLEPERRQQLGRARVPRVGDDERGSVVQGAEVFDLAQRLDPRRGGWDSEEWPLLGPAERRNGCSLDSSAWERWAATWSIASIATRTMSASCSTSPRTRSRRRRATGASGHLRPRGHGLEARDAARRLGDGPGGRIRPTDTVNQLADLLDEGDTIIDGGNSRWSDDKAPRRGAQAEGHPLRGRGHERRRLGPRGGLLHDGRRPRRGGGAASRRSSTCSPRPPPRSTGRAGGTSARPAPATT